MTPPIKKAATSDAYSPMLEPWASTSAMPNSVLLPVMWETGVPKSPNTVVPFMYPATRARNEPNAIRAQRSFNGRVSHFGGFDGEGISVYFVLALGREG